MIGSRHALLVDDDRRCYEAVNAVAGLHGFSLTATESLGEAKRLLHERRPRLALVNAELNAPGDSLFCGGLFHREDLMLVVMSAKANIDSAVSAIRQGAHDFLEKPPDTHRLGRVFAAALGRPGTDDGRDGRTLSFGSNLIGASLAMRRVVGLIERVGPTDASVLITGESGTGKDLVAQALHQASHRAGGAFLPVNCGAVSPHLIESELFGHERGSFTGATQSRRGYFESADRGTLFLDEVTEMPLELQAKLLRVLENGTILRVGQNKPIAVNVRILAATNRDPEEAVAAGILREDLLYRLNVFPLHLPPLRDRRADIVPLAHSFLDQLNRGSKTKKKLTTEALERLQRHDWPGNVRELRNAVHRAFILADDLITPQHLPSPSRAPDPVGTRLAIHVGTPIHEAERRLILATLHHHGGNKTATAETLGISLKTLYNKLNAYRRGL